MKKFLVVLLSLGLIAAFSMPASAADVKVSGSYNLQGGYDSNPELRDTDKYSKTAFYNAIRIMPVFQVAEGLTFTMRFDAQEKVWGDSAWRGQTAGTNDDVMSSRPQTAAGGTPKIQENIEIEYGFVSFNTAVGKFDVGYMNADGWGTAFFNQSNPRPRIQLTKVFGPLSVLGVYEKRYENVTSAAYAANHATDADYDTYALAAIYKWKAGQAGLMYKYWLNNQGRLAANPFSSRIHQVAPYAIAKFGPVDVEAEVMYFFGKTRDLEAPAAGVVNQDADTLNAGIKATYNLGPAYFGAQYAYASGNNPNDATKNKQLNGLGIGYDPTLIIGGGLRQDIGYDNYLGGVNGTTAIQKTKQNLVFYNAFGGYNVTPKLNVAGSVTYAHVASKPNGYQSSNVGIEVDLGVTYKIYDNLSYLVQGGYLFAGDYWKGANNANAKYGDEYVVINKLTLNF
ncbi:MAG: porin [Deltaproteobacteria bacterium]|nr:porin [Deltaproteobacteria bacterium]